MSAPAKASATNIIVHALTNSKSNASLENAAITVSSKKIVSLKNK